MKNIILLLFLFSFFSINVFAESNDTTKNLKGKSNKIDKENLVKYKLKVKFPLDVYHIYRMTETSQISRTYSDNNVTEFNRDVNYYFTLRLTTSPTDGLTKVFAIIDSMDYEYKMGSKIVKTGSQSHEDIPLNNKDFLNYLIPVSKEFYMTYSAYNDVAKIEGDILFEKRAEYADAEKGIKDSLSRSIFLNGMSDKTLKFITDISKGVLPITDVTTDTVWKSPFYYDIAGLRFNGNAKTKIKGIKNTTYLLESLTDSLKIENKVKYYEDINADVNISNGISYGVFNLDAASDGAMTYAKAQFTTELNCNVNKVKFKEVIKTKTIWDLLERFRY